MIGPAGFMAAPKAEARELKRLDDKGRCCGRKPIYYKGMAWNSPLGCPKKWCDRCNTTFNPETGIERLSDNGGEQR